MSAELESLKEWIGRTETAIDYVTVPAVNRLSATLDRDDAFPKMGDPLPVGWHSTLFPRVVRHSQIGPDAGALHEEVGAHAAANLGPLDALVAVGPHAAALVAAARTAGFTGQSLHADAFSEAVAIDAAELAPRGSAILLKGSRGARMERFLEPLKSAFATD